MTQGHSQQQQQDRDYNCAIDSIGRPSQCRTLHQQQPAMQPTKSIRIQQPQPSITQCSRPTYCRRRYQQQQQRQQEQQKQLLRHSYQQPTQGRNEGQQQRHYTPTDSSSTTQTIADNVHRLQPEPQSVHLSAFSKSTTTTTEDDSNNTGSPAGDEQPNITYKNHLTISIKQFTFSALIDTGSCRSICTSDLVKQLKYSVKPLESGELGMLFVANGSRMKILGKVVLPIKIQGLLSHHTFYVTDSTMHEIILGLDFLEKLEADIDLKSKTISFLDFIRAQLTVITEHGKQFVSTKSTIVLQPTSESVIPVFVVKSYPLHQLSLIEPLPNSHHKFCVARCLVKVKEARQTFCKLLNPTDSVITIAKGTVVATIEPIDDECANMFSVDTERPNTNTNVTTDDKTCQSKSSKKLSEEEKQKILSDLGVKIGNGHLPPEAVIQLENLIVENADLFAKDMIDLPPAKLEKFKINTGTASPIRQRSYKQPPAAKDEIGRQINKMLDANLISPSNSVWSSPVILVKKKVPQNTPNAPPEYRMCVDYRKINKVIKQESFPLPLLQDTIESLSENPPMYFCSLDFKSAYSSIELEPETSDKLTFVTHLGAMKPHRLNFGISSAPSFFQRVLSGVFRDVQYKHLSVYIDDLLSWHNDVKSMIDSLREIFEYQIND